MGAVKLGTLLKVTCHDPTINLIYDIDTCALVTVPQSTDGQGG